MLREPPEIKIKPKLKQLSLTTNEITRLKNSLTAHNFDGFLCLYCGEEYLIDFDDDIVDEETLIKRIEHKKSCIMHKLYKL